jgi:hypothetical protein
VVVVVALRAQKPKAQEEEVRVVRFQQIHGVLVVVVVVELRWTDVVVCAC